MIIGLLFLTPRTVLSAERQFAFYHDPAEALISVADAFMKNYNNDVKKKVLRQRKTDQTDDTYIEYTVAIPNPVTKPQPGYLGWEKDITVMRLNLGVTTYLPLAHDKGKPITAGPKAEKTALHYAFQHIASLLEDDRMHRDTIVQTSLPEDYLPSRTRNMKPDDPRYDQDLYGVKVPGSYFFYETRTYYYVMGANVFISISCDTPGNKVARPNTKALAEAILRRMSGSQSRSAVEVYPYQGLSPSEQGLIPASDLLPAKIVYKGGTPNSEVTFSLQGGTRGELRSGKISGKLITVTSDAAGSAETYYYYKGESKSLTAPLKDDIRVTADGETKTAQIHIGLGLAFDKIKAVLGQTYENNTYAFTLSVKSTFHPDLNIAAYLFNAEQSKAWGDKKLGIKLFSEWVNRPADAEHDEYYKGTANITASQERDSILTANHTPWYTPPGAKFFYPAVVMKTPGRHAYRVNGQIAVLNRGGGDLIAYLDEKMVKSDTLLILSKEDPERWYQSLACSLNATTTTQWFMLEAVKMIPVYGDAVDQLTAVTSLVCGLLKEDYEKSIIDLASWLGGKYIDNLMEPEVFNKLTQKQQDAVIVAKTSYFGTDMYKKKGEIDDIRNK